MTDYDHLALDLVVNIFSNGKITPADLLQPGTALGIGEYGSL